ncbi:MAG: LD-carboxypeptidase [Alphaproteobacteria bacterium]|nr:LD-carboxypeptidase [Alphaproteobacteria bacterium]
MKRLIKPAALKPGDTIAAISLSWGGPGAIPHRYEQGKRQFMETFGVRVVETPHARAKPDELSNHPEKRLDDLIGAFKDPDIKGIVCTIGGNDTNRLIRLMTDEHYGIIRDNPKVFMGFSDTSVNHFMCYRAGLSSFYGGCFLFTFAENGGIPAYTAENIKKTLFDPRPIGVLPESPEFIVDTIDWNIKESPVRPRRAGTPWRYINGRKPARGRLIGGCFDSFINSLNGTALWLPAAEYEDTILFLEICEEMPPPASVKCWLRLLGVQGILDRVNGILFARPGNDVWQNPADADAWVARYPEYDQALLDACREFGRTDMPIVTNMDFGHTMPQLTLPYGALCAIDPPARSVSILDSGVE